MATNANKILAHLPAADRRALTPLLEHVDLRFKEPIHAQGKRIDQVFFPTSGVVSSVIDLNDGQTVETGTIGREGIVGLAALMEMPISSQRLFVQVPGAAFRVPVKALLKYIERHPALRSLSLRYASIQLATLSQIAVCNRVHTLEERLARWLLMTRDRVDSDAFPLTQQFLSQMLGVRRPTVSLAGAQLQKAGLIKYSRGMITVLDRAGLEAVACECYAIIRDRYEEKL